MAGAPRFSEAGRRFSLSPGERAGVRASVTLTNLSASRCPARIKRASLPWHAVVAAVEGKGETVTTETMDA
jgi:hypothetical protein